MVDTSDSDRLQESINELQARYVNTPAAVDIPIAVVLNKTDQCLDVSSFIDRFTELMIDLDVKRFNVFQITTAQPNDLQEPSEWLRTQLQENKELIPPSYR